eukprot:5449382-Pyramimonas_sp.AAC.1
MSHLKLLGALIITTSTPTHRLEGGGGDGGVGGEAAEEVGQQVVDGVPRLARELVHEEAREVGNARLGVLQLEHHLRHVPLHLHHVVQDQVRQHQHRVVPHLWNSRSVGQSVGQSVPHLWRAKRAPPQPIKSHHNGKGAHTTHDAPVDALRPGLTTVTTQLQHSYDTAGARLLGTVDVLRPGLHRVGEAERQVADGNHQVAAHARLPCVRVPQQGEQQLRTVGQSVSQSASQSTSRSRVISSCGQSASQSGAEQATHNPPPHKPTKGPLDSTCFLG